MVTDTTTDITTLQLPTTKDTVTDTAAHTQLATTNHRTVTQATRHTTQAHTDTLAQATDTDTDTRLKVLPEPPFFKILNLQTRYCCEEA